MAEKGIFRRVFGGNAAPPEAKEDATPAAPTARASWFKRLKSGLARSSGALSDGIASIFTSAGFTSSRNPWMSRNALTTPTVSVTRNTDCRKNAMP
ncbi:MAG: hypothetical protein F9K43_19850, partial [Bauldia sp.]